MTELFPLKVCPFISFISFFMYFSEDLTFDVQVDVRRPVPIPHRLEGIGKIDLIKLRVQTCGHAGVILERNQTRVILNIMHKNVIVTKCEPHCKNTSVYENEYNDVPDRNCTGKTHHGNKAAMAYKKSKDPVHIMVMPATRTGKTVRTGIIILDSTINHLECNK